MRLAEREGLRESCSQASRIERSDPCEQGNIGKVFHPRVRSLARHCVRVQLLRNVRLDRMNPRCRRGHASEREHILCDHDLRLSEYWVTECDIDTERLCVRRSRECALDAKPKPVVLHPFVLDLRLSSIRGNFERHEVVEVLTNSFLKLPDRVLRNPLGLIHRIVEDDDASRAFSSRP